MYPAMALLLLLVNAQYTKKNSADLAVMQLLSTPCWLAARWYLLVVPTLCNTLGSHQNPNGQQTPCMAQQWALRFSTPAEKHCC